MPTDIGTGLTMAFATSSFTAEITSVSPPNRSRPSIDTTHMGSSTRTFMPGDLVDGGEVTMEVHFDPDMDVPVDQPAEQITITFPLADGGSTAANWQFPGFVISDTPQAPLDDKMVSTIVIKVAGDVTKTAAT